MNILNQPRTVYGLTALSAIALAIGLVSQYAFGYPPCELCIMQRWWHGAVVASGIAFMMVGRPRLFLTTQTAALIIGTGFALFHVGVEQHWWTGSAACVGPTPADNSIESLTDQLLHTPVVRCDEVRWQVLGLSMAAWNAILSGAMAVIAMATSARKT